MTDSIHTETYKGLTIEIFLDDDCAENPVNSWDFLGRFVCFHSRYDIGHENESCVESWLSRMIDSDKAARLKDKYNRFTYEYPNNLRESLLEEFEKDHIFLPVYMYDHSVITINTSGFSCSWDSGQVGFVYVSKDKARKEYGVKRISPKLRKNIESVLRSEIESIDQYLTGQVYGFRVSSKTKESIDSCWGFYGDYNGYVLETARESADYYLARTAKKARRLSLASFRPLVMLPFSFRPDALQSA